ncbi:MAG TPA: ABC transporter ATP-binding protein [Anaerolineales bacterium]|jgi:iron(III) transport system ATP-binding protein|nr:ABC transporter ATP-binding protein [Anaerolineales bacterium]
MHSVAVSLEKVSKKFGPTPAVYSLDLGVHKGEILSLLGPSGCGKTTVLRLIAGFERPDSGNIYLGGRLVAGAYVYTPPESRGVGMVFQDYALFPHLSVQENVAFGLKAAQNGSRDRTLASMLSLVGLSARANDFPHELSGGERQRVAVARALAPQPILVLLDEPLSNLDADLRLRMREELRVILRASNATAVFVTHDQEEALYIGDRLAVMNNGRIQQVGTPEEVFHRPTTRFVAQFMGNSDFLPGVVAADGVQTEIGLVPQKVDAPAGISIEFVLRADDVRFSPEPGGGSMILARQFRGATNLYRLRLPSGRLLHAFAPHAFRSTPGTPVRVWLEPGHDLAWFKREP